MDALVPEISDFILDLVALDRPSSINLSSVSKSFRRRLAPRIFRKLVIKNILRGENSEAIYGRLERFLEFAATSKWNICVESIEFEMQSPNLENLIEDSGHDLEAADIVSSCSVWFPERLTYILSNLSTLFPSLHTLGIRFPDTSLDFPDSFGSMLYGESEIEEDSDYHVLIKLLNLTFDAVAENGAKENTGIEPQGSGDNEMPFQQRIMHFSISQYPPFGCDALLSPRFGTFLSNIISFSLEIDQSYNLDEGAYGNEILQAFLRETIPESFLSHFYGGTALQNLRFQALSSCCFGVTDSLCLKPQLLGSLKKLVLENIVLSYQNTIRDTSGLGAFIKSNSSTLEVVELNNAGWVVESFEPDSVDHWGSFWVFLREHQPVNLRRLKINEHFIDRDLQKPHAKSPESFKFHYETLDYGWGYMGWNEDNEGIPEFRRDEDLKSWNLLRKSVLAQQE